MGEVGNHSSPGVALPPAGMPTADATAAQGW